MTFPPADKKPVDPVLRPLAVFVWAAIALSVTVGLTAFLAHLSYRADPQRLGGLLDVVRIGLSVGVGTGGLFALWLATRRQRSAEQTLVLQREVSATTVVDSTERRITEQYNKAIEQLGHEKAAVRLGAIYSLERLAQEHAGHRQTVVDVFCSYLRLPFEPPEPDLRAAPDNADVRAELEVRRTIQSMLWEHLGDPDQRAVGQKRWADIDLDLSRTTLVDPILRMLAVRTLTWQHGVVHGHADLSHLRVTDFAQVGEVLFRGRANFSDAVSPSGLGFIDCQFDAELDLSGATIGALFNLISCRFAGDVDLSGCDVAKFACSTCGFEGDLVLRNGNCDIFLAMKSDFQGTFVSENLKASHGQMINCSFRTRPERHPDVVVFDDIADSDTTLRNMVAHLG